jgi:hypothetical protein
VEVSSVEATVVIQLRETTSSMAKATLRAS